MITRTGKEAVRAAVYARISDDKRDDEAGVERQRDDALALIERNGWSLAGPPYIDNDVSAFRVRAASRPQYAALMQAIGAGEIDVVVVYQTSRLWRDRSERAHGIKTLQQAGVSVSATKGPSLDLSSAYGRGMAGLLGEFDTMESEVKSERVLSALEQNAQAGRTHGRQTYGWDRRYDDHHRPYDVVNPDEAAVIREIAERILRGDSINAITGDLNARGIPAPADAKRLPEARRGTPWAKQMVRAVVQRERNAGLRVHRGEVIGDGSWEPIVDRGTWERVCATLKDPARKTASGSAAVHLLSGIAKCGVCGAPVRGSMNRTVPSYKCSARSCVSRTRSDVDAFVTAVVLERLSRPDARSLLSPQRQANLEAAAELTALEARLDHAADDYADGKLERRQLDRITSRLRPLIDDARTRARVVDNRSLLDGLIGGGVDVAAIWESLSISRRRAVVDAVVSVRIQRARQGARAFDPETVVISWR